MRALDALSARLQTLSFRERVLVGACLLCVAGFAAARWGVLPAWEEYRKNRAAVPQRLATIARYEAIRQSQERIDEELYLTVQQLEKWEEGLLAGETTSAAGVFLQGVLRPLTQGPDTRVTSVRGLPPVRKGAYAEVAVQLDIQTSTEGLASLLAEIARQPKILRVRKFTANSGAFYAPAMQQRKEVVTVSMVVAGLSTAPADEKPAGGGEE